MRMTLTFSDVDPVVMDSRSNRSRRKTPNSTLVLSNVERDPKTEQSTDITHNVHSAGSIFLFSVLKYHINGKHFD